MAAKDEACISGSTELWEKYEGFIKQQAYRYFNQYVGLCNSAGVTVEDLIQEGYFALMDAVRAWKSESGYALISYIKYPLMNRYRSALGIRSSKRDPLSTAMSLDSPLSFNDEGSEATIEDTLSVTEDGYEDVDQEVYVQTLRRDFDNAMTSLDEQQIQTIKSLFYDGGTLLSTAKMLGVSPERVRQVKQKAFSTLRRNRRIKEYRQDIISHHGYSGSLSRFLCSGISGVEYAVEKLSERY